MIIKTPRLENVYHWERRLKFKFTDSSKWKPSKHEFDRSLRYIIIQFHCWKHVCLFSNIWLVCWMNERVCIFVCLMRPLWLIHHRFWYSIEYHILVDLRLNLEFYVNTFSSEFLMYIVHKSLDVHFSSLSFTKITNQMLILSTILIISL